MTDTSGYMDFVHECLLCRGRFSDEETLRSHICPDKSSFIPLEMQPVPTDVEELWDWRHGFEEATEIAPGVTLRTKDGRKIGNAIVVMQVPSALMDVTVWLVETDFGNEVRLTEREINDMWWLGWQQPYEQWLAARREKVG